MFGVWSLFLKLFEISVFTLLIYLHPPCSERKASNTNIFVQSFVHNFFRTGWADVACDTHQYCISSLLEIFKISLSLKPAFIANSFP